MKLNKLFFGLLGIAALSLTACSSNDDDFELATVSGQQVYFGTELGETFEIDANAGVVNLPLHRLSTSGSYTATVKATQEDGSIYTIPNSVTFEDGEALANLPISYDQSKVVRGNYEELTLQLTDEANTTPFGASVYKCKIGLSAWSEWQKWNDNGTATYLYSNFFSGDDPDVTFLYRQSSADPNQYQFKIGDESWGVMYGIELVLDYDKSTGLVTCPVQFSGYNHPSYGPVNITDAYNYWYTIRNKPESFAGVYGSFDEENGYIYIPLAYYVGAGLFGDGVETIVINGYDRKDLSAEVVYTGKFFDAEDNIYAVSQVTLGEDVSKAYVALVAGDPTEEDLKAIAIKAYQPLQEITESGEIRFNVTEYEDGSYTLVVLPFFESDALEPATAKFLYTTAGKETWSVVGNGVYTYGVSALSQNAGSLYEGTENATLYVSDSNPNKYYLSPWASSEKGLQFTIGEDGLIRFFQETGDEYVEDGENYGMVYFIDIEAYYEAYASYLGSYDDATKTYSFVGIYYIPEAEGGLGLIKETFTLNDEGGEARSMTRPNKKHISKMLTKHNKQMMNFLKVR